MERTAECAFLIISICSFAELTWGWFFPWKSCMRVSESGRGGKRIYIGFKIHDGDGEPRRKDPRVEFFFFFFLQDGKALVLVLVVIERKDRLDCLHRPSTTSSMVSDRLSIYNPKGNHHHDNQHHRHILTDSEKLAYIDAELCLMAKPSTSDLPGTQTRFDDLQAIHQNQSYAVHNVASPSESTHPTPFFS